MPNASIQSAENETSGKIMQNSPSSTMMETSTSGKKKANKYVKSKTTSIISHLQASAPNLVSPSRLGSSHDDQNVNRILDVHKRPKDGEKTPANLKFVQDIKSFFDRLNLTSPNPKITIKTCGSSKSSPSKTSRSKYEAEVAAGNNAVKRSFEQQYEKPAIQSDEKPQFSSNVSTNVSSLPLSPAVSRRVCEEKQERSEVTTAETDSAESSAGQFSKVKYLSFPPSKSSRNEKFPLSAKPELKYQEIGVITSSDSQTLVKALISPNKLTTRPTSTDANTPLNKKTLFASSEMSAENLISPKKGFKLYNIQRYKYFCFCLNRNFILVKNCSIYLNKR